MNIFKEEQKILETFKLYSADTYEPTKEGVYLLHFYSGGFYTVNIKSDSLKSLKNSLRDKIHKMKGVAYLGGNIE